MGIDVTIIRLITVVLTLLGGPGLIIYIIAAVVMPDEPNFIDRQQ
jgi:phage shock protein C